MRVRALIVFALLLAPSAAYIALNRDMPEFGRLHDDGLLFVSAKSLAEGHGFRIASLPGDPAQTKYPVLYPLFLAAIWKLNPHFPENLWLARLSSWFLLAIALALCWIYYRRQGFSEGRTILLTALLGLNPYMILFGANTFSEVFFLCLLLAALLLAPRRAMLSGFAAGCAYLARTAGIALLILPVWYILRKEYRRAARFAAGMIPFVIGWMLWSRHNMLHTLDPSLIYYVDYVRMEFLTVGLDNIHIVLWKNLDGLLYGMGGLAIPQVIGLLPVKILTQVVGVAMLSGCVRLFRRGIMIEYSLFAVVSCLMLLVWHFPPNERFVLPIFPLLLAGLLTELEHIASMLRLAFRHKDAGQRVAAGIMTAAVGAMVVAALAVQGYMSFDGLYSAAAADREKLAGMRAAYRWIAANTPANAEVLSSDDPLLYLYSNRRGHAPPLVPRSWYGDDHHSTIAVYRDIAAYCRTNGFEYFYSNPDDLSRWTDDPGELRGASEAVRHNPDLKPVFSSGFGIVYRVEAPQLPAAPELSQTTRKAN